MRVNPEKALNRYKAELRAGARPIYAKEAERFLEMTDGVMTAESALAYLDWMKQKGYAMGTIVKQAIPVLKKLYRVNDVRWPLKKGELPELKATDTYQPALDPKLVRRMIEVSKSPRVSRLDRAYMALASTYGVRRIEMSRVTEKDIDMRRGQILIHTAKDGEERIHLIPTEICEALDISWKANSPSRVSKGYQNIEQAAQINRMRDVGWHSIRRILVKLLVDAGLPHHTVTNYLRWSSGRGDMQTLYYNSQIVGEDDTYTDLGKMYREIDEQVFNVHPFLKYWR